MGAHLSGGSGKIHSSNSNGKSTYSFNTGDKSAGGALIGWNFEHDRFVYGVEGGISVSEIKGGYKNGVLPVHHSDYVWNAEARIRAGYKLGVFLPYVTAGGVVGEFYQQSGHHANGTAGDINTVYGYTVGGGLDTRVAKNLTLRSEYLYQKLGKQNYRIANVPTVLKTDFDVHLGRMALLYHFGNPMDASETYDPAVLFSGPSFGVHTGFAGGEVTLSNSATGRLDVRNFTGGLSIGYLYPVNAFRVGVEGSIDLHSGSSSANSMGALTKFDHHMIWHASLRAKIGYVFDRFMPYVSGGANLGQFVAKSQPNTNSNLEPYKNGFSVGGGVEYALTDRASVNLDYSYNNYDSATIDANGGALGVGMKFHQVRLGLVLR